MIYIGGGGGEERGGEGEGEGCRCTCAISLNGGDVNDLQISIQLLTCNNTKIDVPKFLYVDFNPVPHRSDPKSSPKDISFYNKYSWAFTEQNKNSIDI